MVGRLVTAAVVVLALGAVAHAESPKLAEARKAIDAVRFDDAQALLVGALKDGGNGPAEVAEIYRLSASAAVVLGQRDVAEQYYRRWLAIDPTATLSNDVAPKLREPFISAEAYINAHGRLSVHTTRRSPTEVHVIVESDPLKMVAYVALDTGAPLTPRALDAERSATLTATDEIKAVVILDELGNRLLELPAAKLGATSVPGAVVRPPPTTPAAKRSLVRNWKVWAVPSLTFGVVGLYFGSRASSAQTDLDVLARDSRTSFYSDFLAVRDRRDRNALIANGLFIAGGVTAAVAVVLYVTRDRTQPTVVPTAEGGAVGLAVSGGF